MYCHYGAPRFRMPSISVNCQCSFNLGEVQGALRQGLQEKPDCLWLRTADSLSSSSFRDKFPFLHFFFHASVKKKKKMFWGFEPSAILALRGSTLKDHVLICRSKPMYNTYLFLMENRKKEKKKSWRSYSGTRDVLGESNRCSPVRPSSSINSAEYCQLTSVWELRQILNTSHLYTIYFQILPMLSISWHEFCFPPFFLYLCSERYAQRPVHPIGPSVHRPGRYSLLFVRNIGMEPIHYNGVKDLGPADMIINC